MPADEFATAKVAGAKPTVEESTATPADTDPKSDPNYVALLTELQRYHRDLLKMDLAEDPVQAGEYQGHIRLAVNKLFAYMNIYIDLQVDISEEYARTRQALYVEQLKMGKSPSAADKHAGEMTRIDSSNLSVVQLRVKQIQNEYERYNGIAIYLASRAKGFNTERIMG